MSMSSKTSQKITKHDVSTAAVCCRQRTQNFEKHFNDVFWCHATCLRMILGRTQNCDQEKIKPENEKMKNRHHVGFFELHI